MKGTVLIIEDDHETRVALRSVIEGEGFTVLSEANGAHGFHRLRHIAPPVLVVLDQNMPLSTGDDFMRLKREDKRLADVPVIVISAVENRVGDFGVSAFLRKPFDTALLVRLVRRLLVESASQISARAG